MDPLFVRVYLKLLLSLLLGGLLFVLLVVPQAEKHLRSNIAQSLSPPIAMMAQTLADARAEGRPVAATLERGSRAFATRVELVPEGQLQLDAADRARLAAGAVVMVGAARTPTIYSRVDGTDEVLLIGPINQVHPLGGSRGASIVALLLGAMCVGAYLLLRPIKDRLAGLARTTDRFRDGELGARAAVGADDSLGTVARSFNQMADEIQRLLAAQQELLRTVSHELRTPIQRIHFAIEEAVASDDPGARDKAARSMEKDLDELDSLIDELLTYARLRDADSLPRAEVDLSALVDDLCGTLSVLTRGLSLDVKVSGGPFLVTGDPKLLRRAISNLLVNAIRHAHSALELSLAEAGGVVTVRVEDDGAGVPEDERERIFEPFRSGDQGNPRGGRGFGLGLAIVRRVAQRFDGAVDVVGSPLGGACFRLALPSAAAAPAPRPREGALQPGSLSPAGRAG